MNGTQWWPVPRPPDHVEHKSNRDIEVDVRRHADSWAHFESWDEGYSQWRWEPNGTCYMDTEA